MLSADFVNGTDLRKMCGALNKSGVLKEKIKAVGVKKGDLVKLFLDGVDSVPEGSEEEKKIPPEVLKFYNGIVDGQDPSPEEQEKLKAAKQKKKEKGPRQPSNEQKAYDIVKQGGTDEEIKARMMESFAPKYREQGKDEAFIAKRIGIYTNIAKKRLQKETGDQAPPKAEEPAKEEATA